MRTLARRVSKCIGIGCFAAASLFVVACGASDATSPGGTTGGTNPNGNVITADVGSDSVAALVGTPVTIRVRVKSSTGAPVVNETVTWNVASGGGSVSNPTSTTDVNGFATIVWTLGKAAGPNSLGANITGTAVAIKGTGLVGPLAAFSKMSPDSQTVAATGSVLLTVRTADQYGNLIGKVPVFWSTSGGVITPDSSSTGASGNGQAVFTTPSGVSRYTITATTPGLPALTFIIKTF